MPTYPKQFPDASGMIECMACETKFKVDDYETWLPKVRHFNNTYYLCSRECVDKFSEMLKYRAVKTKKAAIKRKTQKDEPAVDTEATKEETGL